MSTLVIVESPAKCKSISKYLGNNKKICPRCKKIYTVMDNYCDVCGVHVLDIDINSVKKFIDWQGFVSSWDYKVNVDKLDHYPKLKEEVERLLVDGKDVLNELIQQNKLTDNFVLSQQHFTRVAVVIAYGSKSTRIQ